jgi:hypothetical protein
MHIPGVTFIKSTYHVEMNNGAELILKPQQLRCRWLGNVVRIGLAANSNSAQKKKHLLDNAVKNVEGTRLKSRHRNEKLGIHVQIIDF